MRYEASYMIPEAGPDMVLFWTHDQLRRASRAASADIGEAMATLGRNKIEIPPSDPRHAQLLAFRSVTLGCRIFLCTY